MTDCNMESENTVEIVIVDKIPVSYIRSGKKDKKVYCFDLKSYVFEESWGEREPLYSMTTRKK